MENRINWSDEQWASHLGIEPKDLPRVRDFMNENYSAAIVRNKNTNNFTVALYKYHVAPSGFKTLQLMATATKDFPDSAKATYYANNEFFPSLEMNDFWDKSLKIPKRAFQLLSIRER